MVAGITWRTDSVDIIHHEGCSTNVDMFHRRGGDMMCFPERVHVPLGDRPLISDSHGACSSTSDQSVGMHERQRSLGNSADGGAKGARTMGESPTRISELPSLGSAAHHMGNCRPCHYSASKSGCAKGARCTFCHFKHVRSRGGQSRAAMSRCKDASLSTRQHHAP